MYFKSKMDFSRMISKSMELMETKKIEREKEIQQEKERQEKEIQEEKVKQEKEEFATNLDLKPISSPDSNIPTPESSPTKVSFFENLFFYSSQYITSVSPLPIHIIIWQNSYHVQSLELI